MATNNFITNTASLKTTIADIRKLDAKKINAQTIFLGGENIRDIIDNATPTIKHAKDTRTTVTENDRWGQWIETKSDGTIVVHDDWVTNSNPNGGSSAWNTSITKVEDNKAYTSSGFYANVQTEKIKDGSSMFNMCTNLTSFIGDLSNLTDSSSMFYYCPNLTTLSSDSSGSPVNLSSLMDGSWMFYLCTALTSFSFDLPSLTNGRSMFTGCSKLKSIDNYMNLANLSNGSGMFSSCSNLFSFSSDLSSLTNGSGMFSSCQNLKSFFTNLSSL